MKVVLVTGGSRGIGRSIVETFARNAYRVAFTYATNQDAAHTLLAAVTASGGTAVAYQADVRDYSRAEEVIGGVQESLGPISVLINNAGIRRDGAFGFMSPADWQAVIDTNLTGPFNYARLVVRGMLDAGGSIINITSTSGMVGLPGQVSYSASKAGVIGLTKALAKEVARLGVRVNAIAPGFIDTDMTASIGEAVKKRLYATIPMGVPGQPAAVADLALFLAGDSASYITGKVYAVDGGLV
jgi:3-oxoacyl-[acyl-carrier protein] reductase